MYTQMSSSLTERKHLTLNKDLPNIGLKKAMSRHEMGYNVFQTGHHYDGLDTLDPLGIWDDHKTRRDRAEKLNVCKQIFEGRTIFEKPTSEFLKRYNTSFHGCMTDEDKKNAYDEINLKIEADWREYTSRQNMLSQPVELSTILSIVNKQNDVQNQLNDMSLTIGEMLNREKQRQKSKRKKKRNNNKHQPFKAVPKQLWNWRFRDTYNHVAADTTSHNPEELKNEPSRTEGYKSSE